MNISPEKIDEIKNSTDIVSVIGQTVTLKKNGKDHFGLCPFHSEKSPSFSVARDKQMFYCFGCGAAGDVFEFLMRHFGINFIQAVKDVAIMCGISIPVESGSGQVYILPLGTQQPKQRKADFIPEKSLPPAEIWQEKAAKLTSWAHECLLNNSNKSNDWKIAEYHGIWPSSLSSAGIMAKTARIYIARGNPGAWIRVRLPEVWSWMVGQSSVCLTKKKG